MHQVEAKVLVQEHLAARLPQQPAWVQSCMDEAAAAMDQFVRESGRTRTTPPRLAATRDTKLGMVELTFVAEVG